MRDEAGIRGRGPELVRLDQLLADARAGHGAALAIHGEPGTGKSALLRAAVRRATGFRVLECAGDPAESSLPHAALHQLLLPVAAPVSALPEPQAAALEVALGVRCAPEGAGPEAVPGARVAPPAADRELGDAPEVSAPIGQSAPAQSNPAPGFLLGAALLTLFTTLTDDRPLLLAVDDAHLLDPETTTALHFAVRRATNLPLLLLCCLPPEADALRTDSAPGRLGTRPAASATGHTGDLAIERDRSAAPMVPTARDRDDVPAGSRLPGAAGGVSTDSPGRRRSGWGEARDPGPVAAGWYRLPALVLGGLDDRAARELIEERHGALPALRVERVLAVAGGNPLALRELPVGAEEFGGSAFGPVPVGERLRAAYRDRIAGLDAGVRELLLLAVVEERGVLRVLLDAARELGIDESAWEAAESAGVLAVGDGRVRLGKPLLGMAVYDAATPERRRAAHLALAGALTAPGELDQRVCHRAAALRRPDEQLALALTHGAEQVRGGVLTAAAMLRRAAAITPDPVHASTRLAAAARFSWAGGDIESARRLLDRATEWIGADRAAAASGGLAGLLEFVAGEPERAGALLLRDAALLDGETSTGLRELADRANWAAALADPAPVRTRDLEFGGRLRAEITPAAVRQLPPAPLVLLWGKADRAVEPFTRRVAQLRESGERAAAVHLLPQLAIVQFANGRVAAAQESLTEAFELARATGTGNVLAQCWNLHAKIAAMRGDSDLALESLDRALALARPRRAHALIASAHWHLGFHALSVGDPETAYLRLRALAQPGHDARHPTYARLAAMDLVEAATRVGRPAEAAEHYATVRSWAVRSRADWAVASAYACRALISTDEERADHYFRRALAVRRTRHDLNQARTHLLYGAWLRRVRRRADAAEQLRTALESFERMSATPWADRARQELDLTGRRTPAPDRGSAPVLTAQEFRVARMAAQGMTNREIGVDLLLSPRTVGHHLSRVFAKLGLTARGELARIDFDNGLRLIPPH
ncbi:AAA family ATPase [Nocardia sp. NPDC003693]